MNASLTKSGKATDACDRHCRKRREAAPYGRESLAMPFLASRTAALARGPNEPIHGQTIRFESSWRRTGATLGTVL